MHDPLADSELQLYSTNAFEATALPGTPDVCPTEENRTNGQEAPHRMTEDVIVEATGSSAIDHPPNPDATPSDNIPEEGKNTVEDAQIRSGKQNDTHGTGSKLDNVEGDAANADGMEVDNSGPTSSETTPEGSKPNHETKKRLKTRQDFLEDIIVRFADSKKRDLPADDTLKLTAQERQRILEDRDTRHRLVFQQWPRAQKGEILRKENSKLGKMAPNGQQLWGASLLDFYIVRRIPDVMGLATYTSGSKMLAWVKKHGEEEFAKEFVSNAEKEPDPERIEPYDITEVILAREKFFRKRIDKVDVGWQPIGSVFYPDAYPPGWPKGPFFDDSIYATSLRKYIPHSLLPSRLIVHDPWNLLSMPWDRSLSWRQEIKNEWSEKEDVTRIYKLSSKPDTPAKKQDEEEKVAKDEKRMRILETFLADPHTRNEFPDGLMVDTEAPRGHPAPIYIVFPPEPEPTPVKEAHLYLSPSQKIGEGNHSLVYDAEWEVPRSFLVKEELCIACVMEDMATQLKDEDGEGCERRDPKWHGMAGAYVCKTESKPEVVTMMANEDGEGEEYILEEGRYSEKLVYEGPLRVIHTRVQYQNLERGPYCEHIRKERSVHPLAANVSVAAKLSLEHDYHLSREAINYQSFPRHFFEHWSGYNLIHPIHDPVPIGPLAPQFYGYYVPDDEAMDEEAKLEAARLELQAQQNADAAPKALDPDSEAPKLQSSSQDQRMGDEDPGHDPAEAAKLESRESEDQPKGDENSNRVSREEKAKPESASQEVEDQKKGDENPPLDSGEAAAQRSNQELENAHGADDVAKEAKLHGESSRKLEDKNQGDGNQDCDGGSEGDESKDQRDTDLKVEESVPICEPPSIPKLKVRPRYLSPILLIEKCGQPIEPSTMSVDDKQECVSMVLRLHDAGYIHGSVARRNILRTPGPLSASASERMKAAEEIGKYGVHWSYRLIDFGRTYNAETKSAEEVRREVGREDRDVTNWLWNIRTLY